MDSTKENESEYKLEIYETPDPRLDDTVEGIEYIPRMDSSESGYDELEENDVKDLNSILASLSLHQDVFEVEPRTKVIAFETKQDKIKRLQAELLEIKNGLKEGTIELKEGLELQNVVDSIQTTQNKLEVVETKMTSKVGNQTKRGAQLLDKINKANQLLTEPSKARIKPNLPTELVYKKEGTHAHALEKRIQNLESLLGPETQKPDDVPEYKNFGGNISRVYEIMKLLADQEHLEYFIKQIKQINSELEQLNSENGRLRREELFNNNELENEASNKVEQLMEVFDKLESLLLHAPMLSARLRCMGSFHNEAIDLNIITDKINKLINGAEKQSKDNINKVERIKKNLDNNLVSINKNIVNINERIANLANRVEKL